MTPEELDEIEARAEAAWTQMQTMTGRPPPEAHVAAVTALGRATADTAALVAEVRRLRDSSVRVTPLPNGRFRYEVRGVVIETSDPAPMVRLGD